MPRPRVLRLARRQGCPWASPGESDPHRSSRVRYREIPFAPVTPLVCSRRDIPLNLEHVIVAGNFGFLRWLEGRALAVRWRAPHRLKILGRRCRVMPPVTPRASGHVARPTPAMQAQEFSLWGCSQGHYACVCSLRHGELQYVSHGPGHRTEERNNRDPPTFARFYRDELYGFRSTGPRRTLIVFLCALHI